MTTIKIQTTQYCESGNQPESERCVHLGFLSGRCDKYGFFLEMKSSRWVKCLKCQLEQNEKEADEFFDKIPFKTRKLKQPTDKE
jgi:hypothetical protein